MADMYHRDEDCNPTIQFHHFLLFLFYKMQHNFWKAHPILKKSLVPALAIQRQQVKLRAQQDNASPVCKCCIWRHSQQEQSERPHIYKCSTFDFWIDSAVICILKRSWLAYLWHIYGIVEGALIALLFAFWKGFAARPCMLPCATLLMQKCLVVTLSVALYSFFSILGVWSLGSYECIEGCVSGLLAAKQVLINQIPWQSSANNGSYFDIFLFFSTNRWFEHNVHHHV